MARKKRRSSESTDEGQFPMDMSLPDRRVMEKIMRELAADIGEEIPPESDLDRAQEMMYQAFETSSTGEQVRLARKALEISPDCADAYVLLAEHATNLDESMELYQQGVAAGERALGKEAFKEYAGEFWSLLETRPYMRARQGLAQCLWESGRREEAVEQFQEMLHLNPNDNQGVRYSLVTLLLDLDRNDDLRRLLEEYENDASAEWAYARALLAFREEGDSSLASKLLAKAVKVNKHVPAYLLGNKPLPSETPPYITMGGADEAVSYTMGNRRVWLNTPGAISWLRKSLKIPSPEVSKRRPPSWPQRKVSLLRLPQERGETWQVDVMPNRATAGEQVEESSTWTLLIVSQLTHELIGVEILDAPPKPGEAWNYLIDAMVQPREGEAHRPARIVVRRKTFQTAWRTKLRQIEIECSLTDTLDVVDVIRDHLPSLTGESALPKLESLSPEELLALPQESGEVWQADMRPLPTWVTDEGQLYRPWLVIVANRTEGLVLVHRMTQERPPIESLWEAVVQAIRQPMVGDPHRPSMVEVGSAEHHEALRSYLDRAGIECVTVARLEHMDAVIDDLAQHLAEPGEFPSLQDVPGLLPAQTESFYTAAARFYRQRPWQKVLGDTIIKIECDKFHSGPWYAVVMGQSGVQQGLAIYEDLPALQRMMAGGATEEETSREMSALSMMYSEAFEIPVRDLDAQERHGWPVAGPEAYPLVLRVNPGLAMRPPLAWELELLEGCLRSIPDFLKQDTASSFSITVSVGSGELNLGLGLVEEA